MATKDFRYGLHVKRADGKVPDVRWKAHDRHGMKSMAGRLFHDPAVISVCVYTAGRGTAVLYLRKNADGSVYKEEVA
jgi:streptogramin lyase